MEKMTYVKAIDVVLNGGEVTSEVREKLEALKASIAKKNGAERKPTATQTANEGYKADILAKLSVPVTFDPTYQPFWDGHSAEKIVEKIKEFLS